MEITQTDLRIDEYTSESINETLQNDKYEIRGSEDNDIEVCFTLDVRQSFADEFNEEGEKLCYIDVTDDFEPNLNSIQHLEAEIDNIKQESIYPDSLDSESLDDEIERRMNQATDVFIKSEEQLESCNILEELSLCIKKEKTSLESNYLREEDKDSKEIAIICKVERSTSDAIEENYLNNESRSEILKKRKYRRLALRQENRERLRKKAECMREKRKKLYREESESQRTARLAKEASKKREVRMYYETPEQRRKRLDVEAARKREHRMYNETPDERRKRLDREAERRRIKRLTMHANETPEEKRERLNKESAKRREARINQYAKETDEQRQERLRKDALRAREMRFTRSAIETEEERRQRLVKDALRKRELRMHGGTSISNFTELQNIRNFEELNNAQMKDEPDYQLSGHYLGNWMMWFQNTLTQPMNNEEKSNSHEIHRETHV